MAKDNRGPDHNRNWQDDPTPLRPGALISECLVYPFPVAVVDRETGKKTGEYLNNVPILKLDDIGRREAARIVAMVKIKGMYHKSK